MPSQGQLLVQTLNTVYVTAIITALARYFEQLRINYGML